MRWPGEAAREVRQFVEVAQRLRFGLRREQEGDLVDLGVGVAGQRGALSRPAPKIVNRTLVRPLSANHRRTRRSVSGGAAAWGSQPSPRVRSRSRAARLSPPSRSGDAGAEPAWARRRWGGKVDEPAVELSLLLGPDLLECGELFIHLCPACGRIGAVIAHFLTVPAHSCSGISLAKTTAIPEGAGPLRP
jgi:hypothetical protein